MDSLNSAGNNRIADYLEYDLITSEDMREMAKMPGNVERSGAHSHLLYLTITVTLCYKGVEPQITEDGTNTASEHKVWESEIKENKTVEKNAVLEIETAALQHANANGNLQ